MKKYIKYLNSDLKPALYTLPDPNTFAIMYGDGYLDGDLSEVPIKTLAEWLNIDLITLPPADMLTEAEQIKTARTLMSYWDSRDELVQIVKAVRPKRQYESAVELLSSKAQYNGRGGFTLVYEPMSPEELAEEVKAHDERMRKFYEKMDRPKSSSDGIDENLPF